MSRAETCQKRSYHTQLPNAVMSGADHASAWAFGRTRAGAAAARARLSPVNGLLARSPGRGQGRPVEACARQRIAAKVAVPGGQLQA